MLRVLGRYAVAVVAVMSVVAASAVAASASPSADPQHGITVSKGCQNPRAIGGSVTCSFTVSNELDAVNQAHDTVTVTSITDVVVTAGGPVASGELISTLLITPHTGATCNVSGGAPGTGNTLCTLPFGSSITTNAIALYGPITAADFTTFQNTHRLLDQATIVWHDLCDGLDANPTPGGGNCNPEPGPAGAAGSTLIVDANIQISPNGTNEVIPPGQTVHTFTGHVNVSCQTLPNPPGDPDCTNGNGFKNAPDGTQINFAFVGAHVGTLSASSCLTTGGSGSCSVTDSSPTPGVDTVMASTAVSVAGLTLNRATGDANPGDGPNAVKTWVDARISITPNGVNEIVPPGLTNHTFTGFVEINGGGGWIPAPDNTTINFAFVAPLGSAIFVGGVSSCLTAGGTGKCPVTITSPASEIDTLRASTSVVVSGLTLNRATNDGHTGDGPDGIKTWVDANIQITPATDTDPAGDVHTLNGHVNTSPGTGVYGNAPAGTLITFSIVSGPGSFVGGVNTCTTVGATGDCTVQITSATPGTTVIKAATAVNVLGVVLNRETADGKAGDSANAVKNWVDAKIVITPNGVNRVGQNHIFTVTVQTDSGGGFVNAPNGTLVTASIASGPGSFVGPNTCTTSGGTGSCQVTITSAVTGVTVVSAATDVTVAGLSLHRVTDGTNSNSGPASKTWVNARIAIAPDATNAVGQPHTFTVTLQKDVGDGAGFVAAAGEHVDFTLTDSNGATHSAPTGTCTNAGANTNAAGQCTITFTSNSAGKVTAHASSMLGVNGSAVFTVQTDGVSPNSGNAVKTFVDANIQISPNGVNPITAEHIFTAHVNVNTGTGGFVNAPAGTAISFSIDSGPGSFTSANPCLTVAATGSCQITLTSPTTGQTVVSAHSTLSVGGVSLTRDTNGSGANSGPATKTWVTARISIAPDATNAVGQPHTFTVTLEKDPGDGGGFVPAAGEHVTVTLTDSLGANHTAPTGTCTNAGANTNAAGQCTITFTSNSAGNVTGHASATLTVNGSIPITVQTNGIAPNSADAVKTFVNANIQITPATANNPVGSNHVLTITVNALNGTLAAGPHNATASIVSGPGSFVGSPTCTYTGGAATASCTVTITSATPGTTVVSATSNISVNGVSITRTTNTAVNTAAGGSGNAVKNWTGAAIVTNVRNAANADVTNTTVPAGTVVHDDATVTKAAGTPAGAPDPTGTVSFTLYTGSTCNGAVLATDPNKPLNASGVATSVTFTTPATGGSFSYLAHYDGDANYPGLDAACEPFSVVNANIQITPATANNAVGSNHVLTITVNGINGTLAAGTATASIVSGPGSFVGSPTCNYTGGGATASCTVTITSAVTGTTVVSATSNISVNGVSITRTTNTAVNTAAGGSGNASKIWVDANIQITPATASNAVGSNHVLTITVNGINGTLAAGTATASIVSGPGSFVGSPTCNYTGGGATASCTVTITSATAGTTVVSATSNISVNGVSITRTTNTAVNTAAGGSGNASKIWVDANIAITPATASNAVGSNHVLTITVNGINGTLAAGTATASIVSGPGSFVGSPTCNYTGGGATASCTVTITSATAGTTVVSATSNISVNGVSITRTTNTAVNTAAGGSGNASKIWVDANIAITPATASNPVGSNHVLTITVNGINGTLAAGTATASIVSGPGSFVGSPTCNYTGGGATASCTVTITSATAGTTVVSATSNISVNGVSITRTTNTAVNTAAGGSGNASKIWADDAVRTDIHDPAHTVITTAPPGTVVHDKVFVTKTAATPAAVPNPTGNVVFHRYTTNDCTGASTDQTVALAADGTAESANFTIGTVAMSYKASYLGDANYPARDGACEPLAITTLAEGRATGGGSIFATINGVPNVRVTHGFELRCTPNDKRQSLEINWDGGNNFHLEKIINSVICFDDPATTPPPPPGTVIDTYAGDTLFNGQAGFHGFGYAVGTGRCNKEPAMIWFILTDAGEPGTADVAEYHIRGTGCTLDAGPALIDHGNQQFHKN